MASPLANGLPTILKRTGKKQPSRRSLPESRIALWSQECGIHHLPWAPKRHLLVSKAYEDPGLAGLGDWSCAVFAWSSAYLVLANEDDQTRSLLGLSRGKHWHPVVVGIAVLKRIVGDG